MNSIHIVPNPVITFVQQNSLPQNNTGNKSYYYFMAIIILFSIVMIISIYLTQPKE